MAERQITPRQEILLCNKCLEWMEILIEILNKTDDYKLKLLNYFIKFKGKDKSHQIDENYSIQNHLRDISIIPVLLTHIYNSCKFFKRDVDSPLEQKIKEFKISYESDEIRNVRNVIEHLEAYIAGRGRYPDLVVNIEQSIGFSFGGPPDEMSINVFGRRYYIYDVTQKVAMLKEEIINHKESLLIL